MIGNEALASMQPDLANVALQFYLTLLSTPTALLASTISLDVDKEVTLGNREEIQRVTM